MAALPFWHPTGRWAIKIGEKHNDDGERTAAWFYWVAPEAASPPPDVIANAVIKQREWAKLKKDWPTLQPRLEEADEDYDWSKPVWFDPFLLEPISPEGEEEIKTAQRGYADDLVGEQISQIKQVVQWGQNQDTVVAQLRSAGLLPKGILVPTRKVSIWEAMKEYIAEQRKRIDLKIGSRIDVGTYNTCRNNLLLCVGLTIEKEPKPTTKLIDLNKPLIALENADIKAIADHWFTLPGDVKSRRTVKNYLDAFKSFLAWCDDQDAYGFTKPKATTRLLHMAKPQGNGQVTKVNYDLLKTVLKDAPDRTKMYAVFGLFCGFYQTDICELGMAEVQAIDGETYITGYRSKEDAENNAAKILTTHWIPPELAKIMDANKAAPNQWGFFFLNRYRRPMYTEKPDGGKSNAVTDAWETVASGKLKFKQLRKWGWNEIQRYGSDKVCAGETLAKRWAGQEGGGVAASYRFDDYAPVIAAQQAWWAELKQKLTM